MEKVRLRGLDGDDSLAGRPERRKGRQSTAGGFERRDIGEGGGCKRRTDEIEEDGAL